MSPITVGALMGDRETDRGPIGRAYRRVADVLRMLPLEGATIGLVFDIEGTLEKPDYAGFRVDPTEHEGSVQRLREVLRTAATRCRG